MPVVGSGRYQYEVAENWGQLPPGRTFGVVTGVAVDSRERVYICQQQQDPPVMVFNREGNYLDSWGTGFIVEPHTIYIGPDDVIYLADRGAHVALKLTRAGAVLLELGNRGQPSDTGCTEDEGEVLRAAGPFNRPTRLSPSPSGDLYVSDGYRNSRVHRFAAGGSLLDSWVNRVGLLPESFALLTVFGSTRMAWSTCATGGTTAFRFSPLPVSSSTSGLTCSFPPTCTSTGMTSFMLPNAQTMRPWRTGSAFGTKVGTYSLAGTLPGAIKYGLTGVATSIW